MYPNNRTALRYIEEDQYNLDPIAIVEQGHTNEQLNELEQDIKRVDEILEKDSSLTYLEKQQLYQLGGDMRLDWLYDEHGGKALDFPAFEARAKEAIAFLGRGKEHAAEREDIDPRGMWGICMKELDLTAYRAHRYLKESETTYKDSPDATKLRNFADSKMQQALHNSALLMKDIGRAAHGEGALGQKARGTLYELMLTTYARYRTYDREDYDKTFVRTSLDREDRPLSSKYSPDRPKRGFDIVIEAAANTKLIQAKNYNNNDEYAYPIYKVFDTAFGRTLRDMKAYVADFNVLTANSSDPLARDRTEAAGRRLDRVFGEHLRRAEIE